jgi:hypothetical protein
MNTNSKEFKAGYEAGLDAIKNITTGDTLKEKAQIRFDQAEADEDCDFKFGWQKACVENGAVDPSFPF